MSQDETLLKFPCEFPIKVMGRNELGLEKLVVDIIVEHVKGFDVSAVTARESNAGKFISITATFTATSKAQIDAIYMALSKHRAVLMVL
jgi:uncharacterized protein